jgi:cold shock CspA family protein
MTKKELEKKKKEKKQEKQKRKENRKNDGAAKSFDDMIAYVDRFGNITNTPPEAVKAEKVEIEDIQISTPKKEDILNEPLTGRVEYYNTDKGFGFIKDTNSVEKYFFHINNAYPSIVEGHKVTYELERGDRGMNAVQVTQLK